MAVWRNGRTEARAIAPGLPSLAEQERRDQVPRATYQRLAEAGTLTTDGTRRVPRVAAVVDVIRPWGPVVVVCDRFRLAELQDAAGGSLRLVPRVARWSEASEDIRALRRSAADGPLSVARESRGLLAASLAVATVKTDDQGGVRLAKRANNVARDDVAAALTLAAGAVSRLPVPPPGPDARRMSRQHRRLPWRAVARARRAALDRDGWRCQSTARTACPATNSHGLSVSLRRARGLWDTGFALRYTPDRSPKLTGKSKWTRRSHRRQGSQHASGAA